MCRLGCGRRPLLRLQLRLQLHIQLLLCLQLVHRWGGHGRGCMRLLLWLGQRLHLWRSPVLVALLLLREQGSCVCLLRLLLLAVRRQGWQRRRNR